MLIRPDSGFVMGYRSFYLHSLLVQIWPTSTVTKGHLLPEDYLIICMGWVGCIKPCLARNSLTICFQQTSKMEKGHCSMLLLYSCGQKNSVLRTVYPEPFTSNELNESRKEIIWAEKACGFFVQDTISLSDSQLQIVGFHLLECF